MSIYNAYQGIQRNQLDLDAADLARKAIEDQGRDQSLNQTVEGLRTQLGYTPGGPDDPAQRSYQPASTTTRSGPVKIHDAWGPGGKKDEEKKGTDDGSVGGKGDKEPLAPPPPLAADIDRVPRLTSPGIVTASRPALGAPPVPGTTPAPPTSVGAVDDYGRPIRPYNPTPADPTATPPALPHPAYPTSAAVRQPYGPPPPPPADAPVAPVAGIPTSAVVRQPYGPPPPPPGDQYGPPAPSALQRPSGITNQPVGATATYPGQGARQQAGPPPPPQVTPYAPGMATDDRGHYYDPATQQWLPMPTSALQRPSAITNAPVGATITPPGGTPQQQPAQPQPAPPSAPPTAGGASTVGGTVLGALRALSPIGSAQAAEVPPGANSDPTLFTPISTPTLDPRTGDLKALTPAPEAAPKAGAGAPAPTVQPGNMVAVGDSLGVGIGHAGKMPTYAEQSLSPRAVLANIQNMPADNIAGKDVILSSGASNNPAEVGLVRGQVEALLNKGAASVTLVGVGDRKDLVDNKVNDSLKFIASQTGAQFRPVDTKQLADDRVHPTPTGYAGLINPQKGIDALTGQGKPATPATSAQASPDTPPSQQSPAPVPVKDGAVVSSQKGDSQQSQETTTAYAPPVNPSPWAWLQKNDPEGTQWVLDAIRAEGGDAVSAEQLAAHWLNESHFGRTSVNSYAGAVGPMQFMPDTYKSIDPHGQYDVNKAPDALKLAARLLKHLAVDEGLGVGSFATNYAYWRGGPRARSLQVDFDGTIARQPKEISDNIARFYPGLKLTKDLAPGDGTGASYRDNYPAIVQAQTPDEILNIIATTGPGGMGMTDRWRQVEGAMVAAAIAHGHLDAVPHVSDWVAQISHQGAVSNLGAAYNLLSQGNAQGAAGALARAHAFFPDGTYGRFGTSANGTLMAQQYDEQTGLAMGKPFVITQDHIATQMMQLQNPRTFLDTVQKYRKTNAEIALAEAHAQYYKDMPDIKQQGIDARRELQAERERAADERLRSRQQHDFDLANARAEGNNAEEVRAGTAVDADYRKRMEEGRQAVADAETSKDPEAITKARSELTRLGQESQISRELRVGNAHGGAGLAGPAADTLSEDITKGRVKMRRVFDANKNPRWGVYDQNVSDKDIDEGKATTHAYLSEQRASRILGLVGSGRLTTSALLPPAKQDEGISRVGAGLSDPRMAGTYFTNLAGIQPTSRAA